MQNFHVDGVPDKGANASVLASTNRRRLLQEETTSSRVVDSYSSLVASTKGFSNIAVSSMAAMKQGIPIVTDTWLEGPFGWPPR